MQNILVLGGTTEASTLAQVLADHGKTAVLSYAGRVARNRAVGLSARIASLGYGVPGTVLALGVLLPFAGFDNWLDPHASKIAAAVQAVIPPGQNLTYIICEPPCSFYCLLYV